VEAIEERLGEETHRAVAPRLSVVIPTRNEAGNVLALREALSHALRELDYEVVVVDDSTDLATRPLLRRVCRDDDRWVLIEREPEQQTGLGSAVVAGIAAARGGSVCVMDGDLQHPPEIIPALLRAVGEGADLAVASRYMKGGSRAGLAGPSRLWVSRACTWLAQLIFAEARRTSDPLTGFFCCKRRHLAGLELRPMGFKILLELLVCAPNLVVADVPFVFAARHAGESKASTRQGVLFLKHLLSLFVYVPGSARRLKLGLLMALLVGAFGGLMVTLTRGGLDAVASSVIAGAASLGIGVAAQQLAVFRDLGPRGEPDGPPVHYPLVLLAAAGSISLFALLLLPGRHALLASAVIVQAVAAVVIASLEHPAVWKRLRTRLPLPPLDLHQLAKRLGAERVLWLRAEETRDAAVVDGLGDLVAPHLLSGAFKTGQPVLVIERSSPRPQPRVNIESRSALVVPRMNDSGEIAAVAVLVRKRRQAFTQRDLDAALAWIGSDRRWIDPAARRVAIQ
jgi:dolichol-phosphate mannosyltransferase